MNECLYKDSCTGCNHYVDEKCILKEYYNQGVTDLLRAIIDCRDCDCELGEYIKPSDAKEVAQIVMERGGTINRVKLMKDSRKE